MGIFKLLTQLELETAKTQETIDKDFPSLKDSMPYSDKLSIITSRYEKLLLQQKNQNNDRQLAEMASVTPKDLSDHLKLLREQVEEVSVKVHNSLALSKKSHDKAIDPPAMEILEKSLSEVKSFETCTLGIQRSLETLKNSVQTEGGTKSQESLNEISEIETRLKSLASTISNVSLHTRKCLENFWKLQFYIENLQKQQESIMSGLEITSFDSGTFSDPKYASLHFLC